MMIGPDEILHGLDFLQDPQLCIFGFFANLFAGAGQMFAGSGQGAAASGASQGAADVSAGASTTGVSGQMPGGTTLPMGAGGGLPTPGTTPVSAPAPQTPIPPAVQEMMTAEAVMQNLEGSMTQAPTVDFSSNFSTPSGPTTVGPPSGGRLPEGPGLLERVNEGFDKFRQFRSENEVLQLIDNINEFTSRHPPVGQPEDRSGPRPADEPIPQTFPSEIPSFTPAAPVQFRGSQNLGLSGSRSRSSSLARTRSEAIQELIADLRLNRRTFG